MKYLLILLTSGLFFINATAQIKGSNIPKIGLNNLPPNNFGKIKEDSFKLKNEVLNFDKAIGGYKLNKIKKLSLLPNNQQNNNVITKYNMPCLSPNNNIKYHILVFKPTEDITNTSNQMPNTFRKNKFF